MRGHPLRACLGLAAAALAATAGEVAGQVSPPPPPGTDSVTVVPGAIYERGSLHQALLGAGWRSIWTTPITVPVIDLSAMAGGVEPERVGGGMTTQTLHVNGADGRRYVFRSVNKRPVEFEDFAGSALEGLIQDQVASFHPTGAPVVARLLDAVGVLHTDPVFMVVPDDPKLGEFHDQFAGLLVLVEERPDDGPDGTPGFADSRRVEQTDRLFEVVEEDPANRVDAEELLRARLVDLMVGDRDRSHNNHLWARFDDPNGGYVWRVVPRDRDQSFVRFDGILKGLARPYERRLVNYETDYTSILGVIRNAWDIDRNFLVGLDRSTWDRIVGEVQQTLTDAVIDDAVRAMPPEHVAVVGDELAAALRNRRDHLDEAADVLYRIVFSVPDVHGTDADEDADIVREPDGSVTVRITPRGYDTPTFERTFAAEETSELRVYLQGGDDRVTLRGGGADDMLVRVLTGGGHDSFREAGWRPSGRTVLYDGGDDTDFPPRGAAHIERKNAPRPFSWFELQRDLDWGTRTIPEPTMSFDADRGLVLQPGLKHDRYGFMKRPYSERIQIRAGWAFGLQEPIFRYQHLIRNGIGPADLRLRFQWSGIEIINFYGFGNETEGSGPLSYFRVPHKQVTASIAVSVGDGDRRFLELGPVFTYTSTDTTTASTLISTLDPYGSGKFSHAGAQMSFGIDERDAAGTPSSGFRLEGGAHVFPGRFDATRGAFGEAHGQAAGYLSLPGRNPVLALRVAGKKLWGPYPLTEAAFLGGPTTIRGFREQRFAGDASVLGSAELRVRFGTIVFPAPADVGVFGLADVGRVYLKGEGSDVWHSGVGGGFWFALLNRSNVLRLSLVRNDTRTAFDVGIGFVY